MPTTGTDEPVMPVEGDVVVLHGLKGRADLNGTKAVVLKAETLEEEVIFFLLLFSPSNVSSTLMGVQPLPIWGGLCTSPMWQEAGQVQMFSIQQ